ncbi:MAG: hypothetical protein OXI18_05080 [bacterium]|nr:hypothetical protein [bacterium]
MRRFLITAYAIVAAAPAISLVNILLDILVTPRIWDYYPLGIQLYATIGTGLLVALSLWHFRRDLWRSLLVRIVALTGR